MASSLEQDIDIALVSASNFDRVCRIEGGEPIVIRAVHSKVSARMAAPTSSPVPDPESPVQLPSEYADFADIFNDSQAAVLPEHQPYDH